LPDLFDRGESDDLESELIWWATLLGEVRDLDILTERQAALLSALPPELMLGPVSSTIQTELATRRKRATDDLVGALNSERYRKLIGRIHHWRSDPPFTAAADSPDRRDRGRHQDGEEEGAQAALYSRSRCGVPKSPPTSCFIARGRRRSAIAMRWRLLRRSGDPRPTRSLRSGRTYKTCWEIIRMPSSAQPSSVSWAPRSACRSGQNGFSYGILYAREAASGDALLDELKPFL
jgi:hypothetical protein